MKKNLDYYHQEKLELEEKIKQLRVENEKLMKATEQFHKQLEIAVNKEKVEKKKVLDEVTVLKKKVQELEGKLNAPEDFERYTY